MNTPIPEGLRRWPDVESPELQAYDGADLLLLDTAAGYGLGTSEGTTTVVNDHYGALALGSVAAGARGVRVHQDALSGEQAIEANAERTGVGSPGQGESSLTLMPLGAGLFAGARLVILQLPRSLAALEEIAAWAAAHADPDVALLAGGRTKHMSRAMNDVLERHFSHVSAGLGARKSRVLTARAPRQDGDRPVPRFPLASAHDVGLAQPLELRAFGATFGGAKLDPGTRFLLPHLAEARDAEEAVDLGCGNGTIAAYLALTRPGQRVLACDQSAAAVASTHATAEANDVAHQILAVRDDALSGLADGSRELVVLNPPFHVGNAIHAGIALKLIAAAGRVLAPGGELWCVWNTPLGYRQHLARLVGPTRQVARNPKFTVTVSNRS
ncbi:MAG: class I SAM-dependent methyltransferase [Arthrobacter sp.]|uniref:class I SAM-dependent methyltransferase n=1 Tax=unclassified Arthrobacter TaxID=235627 RepID=UPI00264D8F9B|nr:methyltransferase [Micrococcaceae bacterium]MDN5813264.1 methyltransferase [Micrococcaceae bacterium]MDN5824386.1 methyltransferase [Micrococcaceae bacterium]MDN5878113.1 methyltransferase [Micrococcaceae bacterium]MDN5885866.1 methyltransferase [Micrococcaceae bacterium]